MQIANGTFIVMKGSIVSVQLCNKVLMNKTANCIHHTHWDLLWYFTVQDAQVQFSYNFKELLKAFDDNLVNQFYFDGQTAPIDEYLRNNPQDIERVRKLVSEKKLIIGPLNSQLDCFISNGESVLNNLRLGIKTSRALGHVSKLVYLPDSFGHSIDFPKIFNKFGIKRFVITRGVGDHYDLNSEFIWKSNDDSEMTVFTMIAGYGYGCYPFKEGTLFTDKASDYNKIDIKKLIDRVVSYSSLENDFVFLLGFDQNPMMFGIDEKVEFYNNMQKDIYFEETTWEKYFDKIENNKDKLKTHTDELFSTQYHRVHKSIFSARADIKALQDEVERVLTYHVQPMMTMLDNLGIEYDHGLIDSAWKKLILCQTHSSATLTDETNNYIERESINALNLANSTLTFLCKILAISSEKNDNELHPIVVINTLPLTRNAVARLKMYTKTQNFELIDLNNRLLQYQIIKSKKMNHGVLRKDISLVDEEKYYYEHDVKVKLNGISGIGYKTIFVKQSEANEGHCIVSEANRAIENKHYKIYHDENGIAVLDKRTSKVIKQAIYLEESGDEGDSYDYSYPNQDMINKDYFIDALKEYRVSNITQQLVLKGEMVIPSNLNERALNRCSSTMTYEINIELCEGENLIRVAGNVDNQSLQHRVRLIIKSENKNEFSYAGTQYGVIKRLTNPPELNVWKKDKWFEEPSPTFPLLNHVSSVSDNHVVSVFTKSSKEYEFVNENFQDIAITLFRSYGAMGYPDLNRRPGRPSGLDYMIFETPEAQMIKKNKFDLGFKYYEDFDENRVTNDYICFATDIVTYQKQSYDKSFNPIDYFPTNPTNLNLPLEYEFLSFNDFVGCFGSIVKEDDSNDYLLRVYNNRIVDIESPIMKGEVESFKKVDTDFESNDSYEVNPRLGKCELRIIRIKKRRN